MAKSKMGKDLKGPLTYKMSSKCLAHDVIANGENWNYRVLLSSDQHIDSEYCQRDLLKKHLDEIVDCNGAVFFFGDLFDAMQGRNDKRGSKGSLRPELKTSNYLNALVDEAVSFLEPYAHHIAMISEGNHESSVRRITEFSLISAVCQQLNLRTGANIMPMGYSGWIFIRAMKKDNRPTSVRKYSPYQTVKLWYTHGSGGGGGSSKGTLNAVKRAVYVPDADIVCSGHIHQSWQMEICRERITNKGIPYQDMQWHLQLATYKNEFEESSGWWHEKGLEPRPMGGYYLDLSKEYTEDRNTKISITPSRAM
jgi:UDP-2,3-diacylglucosamine pyrophosphatase LpxH